MVLAAAFRSFHGNARTSLGFDNHRGADGRAVLQGIAAGKSYVPPVEIGAVIALFGFNNRWNALMETDIEPKVTEFLKENNYKGTKDMRG